jgi:hypothetical protein
VQEVIVLHLEGCFGGRTFLIIIEDLCGKKIQHVFITKSLYNAPPGPGLLAELFGEDLPLWLADTLPTCTGEGNSRVDLT